MNQCAFIVTNHFYFLPQPLSPYDAFVHRIDARSVLLTLAKQVKYYEQYPEQLSKNIQYCRAQLKTPMGKAFLLNSFQEICPNTTRFNRCYINCPFLHHIALKEAIDQMKREDTKPVQADLKQKAPQENGGVTTQAVSSQNIVKKDLGPIAPPSNVRIPYTCVKPVGIKGLNPQNDEIHHPNLKNQST